LTKGIKYAILKCHSNSKYLAFPKGENELLVGKFQFMMAVGKVVDYDELINQIELAADEIRKKQRKSFLGGIAAFLEAWQGGDDGFARIISEQNGKFVRYPRYAPRPPGRRQGHLR